MALKTRRAHPRLARLIADGEPRYAGLLGAFLQYLPNFQTIPVAPAGDTNVPNWVNGFIPALDAVSIYGLIARQKPRTYVEIGSGNSTRFARRAIRDHGLHTRIVSIDPEPRVDIEGLCDVRIRQPLEEAKLEVFSTLRENDVVFMDGSHQALQNSDATVFLTEVVPGLPRGVVYGMHDVFLPFDYGESILAPDWPDAKLPQPRADIEAAIASFIPRQYSEQYLVAAYLLGGAFGDSIILPCAWVTSQTRLLRILNPLWDAPQLAGIEPWGGAFWLRRG